MFKFAAILLLFVVGHFDSTAGFDNATWLEFNCKEPQFDGLWRNSLRQMLIYNQRLYFFFENYVIRIELPQYESYRTTYPINETVATTGRLDYLWFRTPQYLYYETLSNRPSLLGLNDATGHFLARPAAYDKKKEDKIFVIRESGFGEEYWMKFNQIYSGGNALFMLGPETQNEVMEQIIKKEKLQLGYTRQDRWKIMNVKYILDRIDFVLLDAQGKLDSQPWAIVRYRPQRVVFYQLNDTETDDPFLRREPFVGFLFEIENSVLGSVVHLHRIKFGLDHLEPLPNSYKNLEHNQVQLMLEEFLGCPMQIIKVEQLKGVFTTQVDKTITFYLFINDWYYKTTVDLFKANFKVDKLFKWREDAHKVQLPEGTTYEMFPKEERLTIKYVKEYYDFIYFTWDKQQSYHVNWTKGPYDEGLRVNWAPMFSWHKCAHQIMLIHVHYAVFCFERQYYYYFSSDRGIDVVPDQHVSRYRIASIFEGTDFEKVWNNEDLQAIFLYTHWNAKETFLVNEIVWITYSKLYKFNPLFFSIVTKNLPWNRKIIIHPAQAKNIPREVAGAWPNCLFNTNCQLDSKEIECFPPPKGREVPATSWMAILLLLIVILVFLFTIWVVVDVNVKTNVAFIDNLRTIIRKKIIYPPDSAEKGEQKPGELKSVKSTSSLGATTKRKSLPSLGETKTGAEAKSGGSPKAKLVGKKSAEKLAGKKSAEKLAGKKSPEKLAGKKSAEKLTSKKSAEKLAGKKSPEKASKK